MSEMHSFDVTDHQIQFDWGWKLSKITAVFSKKVVFHTNLEQMFKCTVTNFDTQLTKMQQRLTYAQYTSQLFLIPVVASLGSNLIQMTNSEPRKCVYCSQIDINMECFAWVKLITNIHLVYSAANGNSREMHKIYHEYFPNIVCSDYCMFVSVNRHLWQTGTSAVNRHSTGWRRSVHMPKFDEYVLQCCRIPPQHLHDWSHGTDHCLVWNVACEQELHHFHWQKMQALLCLND